MSTWAYWMVAILFAFVAGLWVGYKIRDDSAEKAAVTQSNGQVTTITNDVNKQSAQLQQTLTADQEKSIALATQNTAVQSVDSSIQVEIHNAKFTPAPAASTVSCPDPLGSALNDPTFIQLYNRAAKGGYSPAAATSAAAR